MAVRRRHAAQISIYSQFQSGWRDPSGRGLTITRKPPMWGPEPSSGQFATDIAAYRSVVAACLRRTGRRNVSEMNSEVKRPSDIPMVSVLRANASHLANHIHEFAIGLFLVVQQDSRQRTTNRTSQAR